VQVVLQCVVNKSVFRHTMDSPVKQFNYCTLNVPLRSYQFYSGFFSVLSVGFIITCTEWTMHFRCLLASCKGQICVWWPLWFLGVFFTSFETLKKVEVSRWPAEWSAVLQFALLPYFFCLLVLWLLSFFFSPSAGCGHLCNFNLYFVIRREGYSVFS